LFDSPRSVAQFQIAELGADGPVRREGIEAVLGDVADAAVDQNFTGGPATSGRRPVRA
jgi:hypothetical protein